MSQVCPSSSHQLVAAAIAFRRARRKFPKNYGLCGNFDDSMKVDKTESVTGNEDSHEQENLPFSTRKCSNSRSSRAEAKAAWSDEIGESGSIKENLLQKPIICSCCRKRNEAAKANEPANVFKTTDQCSAGDALDIVPSKEYNGIGKKGDPSRTEQVENSDVRMMKSFITDPGNSSRCRAPYSHSGRRSPKETSAKLDSVNLAHDDAIDQLGNVKGGSPSEKRRCNAEEYGCTGTGCRSQPRNSRSKLEFFGTEKDNSSASIHRDCETRCSKHSNVDLLRPRRDVCHSQNSQRCCHHHNCCHHCCGEECHSRSSKEKPRLASDTCLCSTSSIGPRACCNKGHVARESFCHRDCHPQDSERISTVQEQNDGEYDDCVGTINHKDSLCILVEKYKTSKKCKHKKYPGECQLQDDRAKDDSNKSYTSETTCQMDDNANRKQGDRCSDNEDHRFRVNRPSLGKSCRIREGDCNQLKNLRSRLVKTGTCCSAKGTPWRHTF
ncbi:PREDICTED: uncharacterized protein LOC107193835 [Dufourea novaeangliae]|uniref:Uncharacterized protein n=1 Tax=Dufourea novaeangliae TaxID=178035 RepID=A0A154NWG1_DUFNO|nr:PREDICTED: uncharacterized protein LOC107193835 [Dufourea novaeangliae]KZC03921.1 hypothetical protein WN55_00101 [Dufourea novaeangliae]